MNFRSHIYLNAEMCIFSTQNLLSTWKATLDSRWSGVILVIQMQLLQGVCQVREVREKSGNSLYPLKSQGKVREFSEKSGKSQGILVKSRNLFLRTVNWRKSIKISIHFKNFWFWEDKYQEKSLENVDRESGKTRKKSGKSQGKVREFRVKNLADTLKS